MIKNIEVKILFAYSIGFLLILLSLNKLFFPGILDAKNLLHWDAEHYNWIKNYGYKDFRVAFFPLFPLIWKITSLNVYSITIFNAIVFLLAFYFLIKMISASPLEIILYLSIPSFFFFILPYSESIFFASSTVLLFGIKNKKHLLILLGLLLSTMARPAFTIFIPALIITELLSERLNKLLFYRITSYLFIVLCGLLFVGVIQHHYTGIWFNFFEVQKGWGNELRLPDFPLTSWGGGLIVRLDGSAMLIGVVISIILCLYTLKAKIIKQIILPKEVIFSFCYLAGISISVLIFRGGSLFSLNRFVFSVPFIVVATNYFLNLEVTLNTKQLVVTFILIFAFWLSFGSYVHIQTLLKYLLLSIYLFLLPAAKSNKNNMNKIFLTILIVVNIFFQFFFLLRFLNNEWVG